MKFSLALITSFLLVSTSAIPVDQRSRGKKIALSKRWSFVGPDGTDVDALRDHLTHVTEKISKGFEAYSRNTGRRHHLDHTQKNVTDDNELASSNSPQKRSTGHASLKNVGNSLWYGEMSVGTPPQTFAVDFDTGSSDVFLPHMHCQYNCAGHQLYDDSASKTSVKLPKTFSLHYGDGSQVQGLQYLDNFEVAGMTAQNQTFGAALAYSSGFSMENFEPDGLVGLAFPAISDYHSNPLFHTLVEQNQTDEPIFGFKLGQEGSELFLGGVNKALFKGDLTWTPVTEEAYWQVGMDGVTLDGKLIQPPTTPNVHSTPSTTTSGPMNASAPSSHIPSIIDTGTTLVIGSTELVSHLYSLIPDAELAPRAGPGFYSVPCDKIPDIGLVFGGKEWKIKKEILNVGKLPGGEQLPEDESQNTPSAVNTSGRCLSGLVGHGGNGLSPDLWVVGDVFLRGVYSAFDIKNKRVGFAELA